jgi:hypothetical protein
MGAYTMTVLAERIEGREPGRADATVLDCELIVHRSTVADLEGERRCGPNAARTPWLTWRQDQGHPTPSDRMRLEDGGRAST